MTRDNDRVSFLKRRLDPAFENRVVSIAPGSSRAYLEDDWHDAIVVVERGEIEVENAAGDRRTFDAGAVLFLVGVPLRALHNRGVEDAVIVAVSRRRGPTD